MPLWDQKDPVIEMREEEGKTQREGCVKDDKVVHNVTSTTDIA